ncbi:uncharacterized protein AB675_8182 [Cyphellophora attinorum]|uniref:Uncharacterized protein n=1 Tax=Cyphellophora attinorum TaxID=1664694 RepID=A0A0N0NMZ3_9EURO|nr:uncharacterized protein AB675_8182 [Phialophora attinorum]KPI41021.1 hypothetical protein AB675_8182 [Phialophora attinorum]
MAEEPTTGATSLQALNTQAVLIQLPIEEAKQSFTGLPPVAQTNLFGDLLSQHRELQQKEENLQQSIARLPAADRHVALNHCHRLEEGTDYVHDPCEAAEAFRQAWQYSDTYVREEIPRSFLGGVDWQGGPDIIRFSEDEPYRHMFFDEMSARFDVVKKLPLRFNNGISSQLLLYRLCATFGALPLSCEATERYKSCWDLNLVYKKEADAAATTTGDGASEDAPPSWLLFQDFKGWCSVFFGGSQEASENALELVNYLVGPKCAHTYDGVLAGCSA